MDTFLRVRNAGKETKSSSRPGAKTPMFPVEFHQAFQMLPFRPVEETFCALSQMVVHQDRFRVVDDPPTGFLHGKAKVDILEIEEKTLIHNPVS
ncbi:MAG: hypothetical protein H6Q44_1376, partial [Deltaproteobacteria bacterium]|nr:hypothetical protein [Deltaproteobacteria bacterium]